MEVQVLTTNESDEGTIKIDERVSWIETLSEILCSVFNTPKFALIRGRDSIRMVNCNFV